MSHALPVVTTTVGIDGFGLNSGQNVLVGDTAETFANQMSRIVEDRELHARIAEGGWRVIAERYSDRVVKEQVAALFARLSEFPVARKGLSFRAGYHVRRLLKQRLGHRLSDK